MLLKNILLLAYILTSYLSHGQVTVYYTYEDFKNEKGENYSDYGGFFISGAVTLTFIKDKKKHKIKCKDMWGFTYKDAFFRTDEFNKVPARLMSFGKIFYYENGLAHLNMLKNNTDSGSTPSSFMFFFSKSLETPVVACTSYRASGSHIIYQQFKDDYPEYKVLFDCINDNYHVDTARRCVSSFEGEEE